MLAGFGLLALVLLRDSPQSCGVAVDGDNLSDVELDGEASPPTPPGATLAEAGRDSTSGARLLLFPIRLWPPASTSAPAGWPTARR